MLKVGSKSPTRVRPSYTEMLIFLLVAAIGTRFTPQFLTAIFSILPCIRLIKILLMTFWQLFFSGKSRHPQIQLMLTSNGALLWPYHPVISTFSDKGKVRNYTDKFSTYAALTTGQQEEVPHELEEHQDHIIFHKTFHFAIYHQVSAVRWKMANHIAEYFQARPSPPLLSGH